MFCKNCGKQIDDSAMNCPYCGAATANTPNAAPNMPSQQPYQQQPYQQQPYQQPAPAPTEKKGVGLGVASLILGVLTILMNLIGIVAIGLAAGAITSGVKSKNKAPVIMGVIAIVIAIALIIVNTIFFNPFANA